MSESQIFTLDIEVYNKNINDEWPQGKYLVHGYDDLFWTDSIDDALSFLKRSIIEGEEKEVS